MANEFVLTMTAANRAGILSAVTRAMAELGGDLRELSQTVVRGYFTMIFSAEFPDDLTDDVIRAHVEDTCRPYGIEVGIKNPLQDGLSEKTTVLAAVHTLRIGGDNYPGVLGELSTVISMHQADIVGMRAVRTQDGGGFEMMMKVAVPQNCEITALVSALADATTNDSVSIEITGSA